MQSCYGFNSFYVDFFGFYLLYVIICAVLLQNAVSKRKFVIILFTPLLVLSALRGNTVGGDLDNYLPYYHYLSHTSSIRELFDDLRIKEPLYVLLTRLVGLLSNDSERAYIVVTSIFSLVGPIALIQRYSKNPSFSILLYFALGFYTNTFNNIRQSMAISIIFISLPFLLEKRNFFKFCIAVVLATGFHYSAIIALLLYPASIGIASIKKILASLAVGTSIFFVVGSSILMSIISMFLFKYNTDTIFDKRGAGWTLFFIYALILVAELIVFNRKKGSLSDYNLRFFNLMVIMQTFALIIQLYASIFPSMTRMTYYFYIPIITTIPYVASIFKDNLSRIVTYAISFVFSVFFMSMVYSYSPETGSNSQGVIPYVLIDKKIY